MSALFCVFLYFRSYSEKLEEYIPTFYKIRYILEELCIAFIWIISQLIICINQLNTGYDTLYRLVLVRFLEEIEDAQKTFQN